MGQGLLKGATSVGLQFATQGLDPTLGGLASAGIAGLIDGLVTAQNPLDPVSKRKGIFAGIADTLTHAIGGFTEIGLIKPGDPVTTAQGLAKLNDFSTIVREQGLGAALETYATSLLYRSSVESLISASNNFSIQQAINAQLQDPNNRVELDGQSVIQISLGADASGNKKYLWVDPTSHGLVASLQGQDYIRYIAPPKVDEKTRTAGATDVEITRTIPNPLTGEQVTAKIRLEAAGVDWIEIQGPNGVAYRITPDNLNHLSLDADGAVRDGILTEVQTGNKLYFRDGNLVASHAKPFANVKIPDGLQVEIPQVALEVTQTADGKLDVRIEAPQVTTTPPETTEPLKTVGGDLRVDLAQQVGDVAAQNLWNKIQALVPQNQAMPNVAVVLRPAEIKTSGGVFGSDTFSYEKGSFYKGDVPRDSSAMIKVDLATGTVSLGGGYKAVIDNGRGTGGGYWSTSSTGGLFPDSIGAGIATSSQMTDSLVIQNAYGLKATGLSFSKVVGEYNRTTISGNSIEIMTVTKEPNPWVKGGIQATETILALWGVWGLTKAGAWGVGQAADKIGEVAPTLLQYFQKAFAAVT